MLCTKKPPDYSDGFSLYNASCLVTASLEACAAENWAIATWDERNCLFRTTLGAGDFCTRTALVLLCLAAVWAAAWSRETFCCVEFLLTSGERELRATVATGELLILKTGHGMGVKIFLSCVPSLES